MPGSWRRKNSPHSPDAAERSDDAEASRTLDDAMADVHSNWEQPPTAEELRRAFTKKRRRPSDESRKPSEFAEDFSADSLFTSDTDDAPYRDEDERLGPSSDRPQDYYYDPSDPWTILGIEPDADWDVVVTAHRSLALRHHPDRVRNESPKSREESEQHMIEINVAYTTIRRRLGK